LGALLEQAHGNEESERKRSRRKYFAARENEMLGRLISGIRRGKIVSLAVPVVTLILMNSLFQAACGGGGGGATTTPTPTVASITISPSTASVVESQIQQLTATAKDSGGNTMSNVTFTWSSDNAGVATVDSTGKATAVAMGTAHISASSQGVTGSATLTVTTNIKTVKVTSSSTTINVGQSQQFTASATDANGNALTGKTFTWTSSNTSVATVDSGGKATGGAAGTATISAASEGVTGTAALTVKTASSVAVTISPASATVRTGATQQFTATVTGTTNAAVTWSVNGLQGGNSTVGTVSSSGLYTAPSAVPSTNPVTVAAISAADNTKSGSASVTITPPGNPSAAGVTDSNGTVTVTSNGLTVPVTLADIDTGTPLAGVAVGLGTDPGIPGHAFLIMADPTGAHPLQFILVEGSSSKHASSSPAPVAVSGGCPLKSGTTATSAITLSNLAAPPGPISTQQTQTLLVDALSNLFTLGPSSLPSVVYGPLSIEQHTVTSQCLTDIGNIIKEHATAKNIFLAVLEASVPELEPLKIVDGVGLVLLHQELLSTYNECWYSPSASPVNNPLLNITSACFGATCILVPQLESPPAPPTLLQLANDYFMQAASVEPAVASVETYIDAGDLGGIVVGTTDSSGSGSVEVPLGTHTVCVDAPGYHQYTQAGFIVSAGGKPLNATLEVSSSYDLTTGTTGNGSGAVSANPAGGSCGADCSSYTSGTVVQLTATPSAGSTFAGWSGACSGTGACSVTMTSNESVSATFNQQALLDLNLATAGAGNGTISPSPLGAVCGSDCYSYASGTVVQVTATPGTSSTFAGWSGGCSGTGACSVTMNKNQSVTATFNSSGGGGGGGGGAGGGSSLPLQIASPVTTFYNNLYPGCVDSSGSVVVAQNLVAAGGSPSSGYTWAVSPGSTLPPGTALQPLTGIFQWSGGTIIPGTYSFSVTVSDGSTTAEATLSYGVGAGLCGVPVQPFLLNSGNGSLKAIVGESFGASLPVQVGWSGTRPGGGLNLPLTWSVSGGQLPLGLVLDMATGVVRGVPLASGSGTTYSFQITVTNAAGQVAQCNDIYGCPTFMIKVQ
jgi:hypothetical protein